MSIALLTPRRSGAPGIRDVARAFELRFAVQQLDHDSLQLSGIDRLRKVSVEPRSSRRLLVLVLPETRQRDERDVAPPRFEPHAPRDFVAAHAGHADVDDGSDRSNARTELERLRTVERERYLVAGEAEHDAQGFGRVAVVVDYEHARTVRATAAAHSRFVGQHTRRRDHLVRQPHDELAAAAGAFAARLHRAAMQLDQSFDESEADAEPTFGTIDGGVHLREHREQPRQHFLWQADAVIADDD